MIEALRTTAINGLETAINAALKYDPGTLRDLSELEGQVLLIDCTMPNMRIAIECRQQQITLHSDWEGEAAVTLQGSVMAMAKMALPETTLGNHSAFWSGVPCSMR